MYEPLRIQARNRSHLVHASTPVVLFDAVLWVRVDLELAQSESNIQQPAINFHLTALSGLLYFGVGSALIGASS
jgi:hypothetical protein